VQQRDLSGGVGAGAVLSAAAAAAAARYSQRRTQRQPPRIKYFRRLRVSQVLLSCQLLTSFANRFAEKFILRCQSLD
jgi:hypothetical protein